MQEGLGKAPNQYIAQGQRKQPMEGSPNVEMLATVNFPEGYRKIYNETRSLFLCFTLSVTYGFRVVKVLDTCRLCMHINFRK